MFDVSYKKKTKKSRVNPHPNYYQQFTMNKVKSVDWNFCETKADYINFKKVK